MCIASYPWIVRRAAWNSRKPQLDTLDSIGPVIAPAAASAAAEGPAQGSLSEIGMALFGPFALPFEITSLILLAAIVGAVVLAKRRPTES
jgi:NADH:ubiquinone oxidoreductase subunit 6 (subunit J)